MIGAAEDEDELMFVELGVELEDLPHAGLVLLEDVVQLVEEWRAKALH